MKKIIFITLLLILISSNAMDFNELEAGGTVEVFKNNKDLKNRKEYLESVFEEYPIFVQYMYVHENAILRVDKSLTPAQAEKYKTNLENL